MFGSLRMQNVKKTEEKAKNIRLPRESGDPLFSCLDRVAPSLVLTLSATSLSKAAPAALPRLRGSDGSFS